jgi:hypothetical protein
MVAVRSRTRVGKRHFAQPDATTEPAPQLRQELRDGAGCQELPDVCVARLAKHLPSQAKTLMLATAFQDGS